MVEASYHSVPEGSIYRLTHSNIIQPPIAECRNPVQGIPCPDHKTSYWRSFATNIQNGGCGSPKKICGGAIPKPGPPHFVIQPVTSKDALLKFFYLL